MGIPELPLHEDIWGRILLDAWAAEQAGWGVVEILGEPRSGYAVLGRT